MRTKIYDRMVIVVVLVLTLLLTPAAFAFVQEDGEAPQAQASGNWAPVDWLVNFVKSLVGGGQGNPAPSSTSEFADPTGTTDEDAGPSVDPSGIARH